MLRDSIIDNSSSPEVMVADYFAAPVLERLTALGVAPERNSAAPAGPSAIVSTIKAWAKAYPWLSFRV
jgi:hypothetical protein